MPIGPPLARHRLPLLLILLALVVLLVLGLIRFGTVLFVIPLFLDGTAWIRDVTGLNLWVARAIALVLIIPLLYLMRWMFSLRAHERRLGMSIFCGVAAVLCVAVFLVRPVNPEEAYYCIHPLTHKILICDRPGTDPQFGMQLFPASPMVVAMARAGKSILDPAVAKFDPESGQPLFGYLQGDDGSVRLYPITQRFDPQTGRPVHALTPDVAEKIQKQQAKPEVKTCPECGARNGPDAKFCHGCGRPL
jgi:ribosomal protein L40E